MRINRPQNDSRKGFKDLSSRQRFAGAWRENLIDSMHDAPDHLTAGHHLLVVEDDPRFCSHLLHLSNIWSLPMTIVPPPSTPSALSKLPRDRFDILLVNFDLEGVNGLEVAEYFNLFIHRIPTTMISGSVEFNREQGDLPLYIDEFISKSKGAVYILRATLEMADRKRHPENYPSFFKQKANHGW